jgi:hypothetical protein
MLRNTRSIVVPTIGEIQEKSLHAALKAYYAQPGDLVEARVGGYFIDIVRGEALLEIQTRNFAAMKPKLNALLLTHSVRLIHPIARERWVVRISSDGEIFSRRKSPRRGGVDLLFRELIRFPELLLHPRFSLEVAFIQEEEIWRDDGQGSWRRKHWSIADRRLLAVVEQRAFEKPDDFRALLPPSLPDPFTTADLATARGCTRSLAGKMAFCLRQMALLDLVGARGRAHLYTVHNPVEL